MAATRTQCGRANCSGWRAKWPDRAAATSLACSGFQLPRPRGPEHAGQHPSPVRSGDFECGAPEPSAWHRLPKLPLEPGARDAEPPELGIHLHHVGAADELDLGGHPPPRRERVVLLTGVQTHSQSLVRPTERLKGSTRIAGRILDVDV